MRRYLVSLRTVGWTTTESYTDYSTARMVARKWHKLYEGAVSIKDNMTGKVEVL